MSDFHPKQTLAARRALDTIDATVSGSGQSRLYLRGANSNEICAPHLSDRLDRHREPAVRPLRVVLITVPELLASAPCPAAAHRLDHCCSYDPYPLRVPLAPTYASAAVGTRSSLES